MRRLAPALLALAASAGFSWWAFPQLPSQVATHFDLNGDPNGWSSPIVASVFIPLLGSALAAVFYVLPRIDPRATSYALHKPSYWTIVNAVLVLLAVTHVVMLGKALGWPVAFDRVAVVGVGLLLIVIGNLMTRLRPNWFLGIRTPWTLSSDTVWRKTHRLGGILLVLAGCFLLAIGIANVRWRVAGMILVVTLATLIPVIYSWMLWRDEQAEMNKVGGKPG
ncbi:MAG: SdpI family protein [Gemmatimonadota bacterium]